MTWGEVFGKFVQQAYNLEPKSPFNRYLYYAFLGFLGGLPGFLIGIFLGQDFEEWVFVNLYSDKMAVLEGNNFIIGLIYGTIIGLFVAAPLGGIIAGYYYEKSEIKKWFLFISGFISAIVGSFASLIVFT
jgi:hypothetical protein